MYLELSTYVLSSSASVNYERKVIKGQNIFVRIGFGYYFTYGIGKGDEYYSIPISLNYLFALPDHNFIDIGLGPNIIETSFESPNAPSTATFLFVNVGFRRHFSGNFFGRVHISPYILNLTSDTYAYNNGPFTVVEKFGFPKTWVGFSIGKQF